MKIVKVIMLILIFISMLISALCVLILSGAMFSFNPNPPKPIVTYGEFPISIIYAINGETNIVSDTIICEFEGYENRGSAGNYRKWKSYLKSGNERITLLKLSETAELYCWEGSPEYYMDDLRYETKEEYEKEREHNFNSYFITYGEMKNGIFESVGISLEEALDKYNFKIIDVIYPEPIENSFIKE